ncbi:MAG: bestrophin family ion channel [Myxococcota bacterium]
MLTKPRYSPLDVLMWTRWDLLLFLVYSAGLVAAFDLAGFDFLQLPWAPVAVAGTAVAFIIGFQNNAAYGRIWEARKIWGGVVNESRSWAMKVTDMVSNKHAEVPASEDELAEERRILVYRHVAWLTALRYGMRQGRPWENTQQQRTNREWARRIYVPEVESTLEEDLKGYLSEEERAHVLSKGNKATAILFLQSKHIRELMEKGFIWEFAFLQLENLLQELFTLQGKSERIKNFPYPRQYATLSYQFVYIFAFLLPFAAIPEFAATGKELGETWAYADRIFVWLAVPFCAVISWIFHTMERIGRVGENPFEGTVNDVPISTISRGIEIDIRQMLGEEKDEIPKPFPERYHIQM